MTLKGLVPSVLLAIGSAIATVAPSNAAGESVHGQIVANGTLSPAGYRSIRIGMRPAAIKGYGLIGNYSSGEPCYVLEVKEVPGLALLVIDGTIKRISIGERSPSSIKTDRGIGLGASMGAVRRVYRPLSIRDSQYEDAPASYLTWLPKTGPGVRFETGRDRRVKVIHVGVMPELGYVERCG